MSYLLYLLYAGLIVDSVIEDILVLEEQDFNPSLVVVAVSGVGPSRGAVVVCGCTLGMSSLQKLIARVLLVAGVGVLEIALEVIDWETWSFSIRQLLFRSSQISTYTLTVRDVLIDSHVAALCPKDHLLLAIGQASLGVCHKAELSLETGQVRLEMLHT